MRKRRLILPATGVERPDYGFRTIGQALTQNEAAPVGNPSGWLLDRLARAN